MKEVMAIIRMNKMNQTKQALADIGVYSMTANRVMGRGKGRVDFRIINGAEEGREEAIYQLGQGPKLFPKRLMIVVVPDEKVPVVVRTLIAINQTGQAGDGKIFVMPLIDVVRVRTGQTGDTAIAELES